VESILELLVAPALVGASTLAARRWGQQIGGLVSAFPAIVGPVLLIAALEHGPAFAARAAGGTLLGLVALSAFVLVYGRVATRAAWPGTLAAAWAAAAVAATAAGAIGADLAGALAAATVSLVVAHRLLPDAPAASAAEPALDAAQTPTLAARWDLPLRMALTALLVAALSAAAAAFGPVAGGILAALPVLASVLAVFTHERHGPAALAELLRGMLRGMAGFVVFCALVAALLERSGIAAAFAFAALAAVAAQAGAALHGLQIPARRPTS
jgi:hypothetical protein